MILDLISRSWCYFALLFLEMVVHLARRWVTRSGAGWSTLSASTLPHGSQRTSSRFYCAEARDRKPLKTYGVLHANVRQLLRIIHPDTFRPFTREGSPNAEKYTKMSITNQRSLQALNAFNSTMKNFQANLNSFLREEVEPAFLEFHIVRPKEGAEPQIKTVRAALQLPHVSKQVWVRHSDPTTQMHHWRDVQILDLLNRFHMILSGELQTSLLPSDQELEVLRTISRQTRIPLPVQFQEPTISHDFQPFREQDDGKPQVAYEDQKIEEMNRRLDRSDLLWREPEDKNDLYSQLRRQNLKESSHPRNPEFHMNKKFGLVFDEPSRDQLKRILSTMQIDFPAGTDDSLRIDLFRFLIRNAKKLKIWEWYHTPIVFGTERYQLVDHCVLGIPFDCNVTHLNAYLAQNLPVIQRNAEIFRQRLTVTADKMLELQESLCLCGVQVDPFVSHDQAEACLDHLLDKKELLDSYNMSQMTIRIHNKKEWAFFSQSSGTLQLPFDISDKQLHDVLAECKASASFANYRIARRSISHIKKILLEKAGIESLSLPKRILTNTLAYQSVLGRLLDYITNHAPYNTLEKMQVRVIDRGDTIKYRQGVLTLPSHFEPAQVHDYFCQEVSNTKMAIDAAVGKPSISKLKQSHLPSHEQERNLETTLLAKE